MTKTYKSHVGVFPDIGEVNKRLQLWISEWGVRPWSILICARHCVPFMRYRCKDTVYGKSWAVVLCWDTSPGCSFPVLLYFNKVVWAREEAVWVFSPKVLWEGQQAVRNTDGPLSSGKRSVLVALMWEITPVGKLQGLRLLAGWRQPEGRKRRPLRKERAGWEQERELQRRGRRTWQVAQDGTWRWEGPGLQVVGSRRRKAGADQAVVRNCRWVDAGSEGLSVRMGLKRAEGRGATETDYEVGWDPEFLRLPPCWKNWDLKRWRELGI